MNLKRQLWGMAAIALAAATANAGNIPQYKMSTDGAPYQSIQGGTPIACTWSAGGTVFIYPDGENAAYLEREGFDIGFEFKFGGHWMDQFIISSTGILYFLDSALPFGDADMFRVSMSPVAGGVEKADISYLTTGESGKRVCTVQFENAILNESSQPRGMYNMQIRLYEEDYHIEVAFEELRSPNGKYQGFDVSLRGWDTEDVVVYTAQEITDTPTISSKPYAYMIEFDSYVHWNTSPTGEIQKIAYRFTPESSKTAPTLAPGEITLVQKENTIDVSLRRSRDARATVLLWSESPITAADMPSDGETFPAGEESTVGDAHVAYYGPATNISYTIPNVTDGQTYYVAAISANGYPAFNVDNMTTAEITTAQGAPDVLRAYSAGTESLRVDCIATHPVIIASTTTAQLAFRSGFHGVFGTPAADAAVGDEIPGGGKVIYIGEAGSVDNIACDPNQITYFRAWTLNGDQVSSNYIDAYAIPDVSLPFAPKAEYYPWGETLPGWDSYDFNSWYRAYYPDYAVYGGTEPGFVPIALGTPYLPLDTPVKVTFEFAMETLRDWAATPDSGGILMPQGSEPGWFGDRGYLRVKTGDKIHKTFTEYHGDMVGFDDTGYNDNSSTFEPMEVEIPAQGGEHRIIFEVASEKSSKLFFRNIVVTPMEKGPEAPKEIATDINVTEDEDGIISIKCKRGADADCTLVLFSDQPMTDEELPVDGHIYTVGDLLGNATVLYFGKEEEVACSTAYTIGNQPHFIFADYDTDYYIRIISGSGNPLYNTEKTASFTYHSAADPNTDSVDQITAADGRLEVHTLTGIRLNVTSLTELPAGLYIINGQKYLVK